MLHKSLTCYSEGGETLLMFHSVPGTTKWRASAFSLAFGRSTATRERTRKRENEKKHGNSCSNIQVHNTDRICSVLIFCQLTGYSPLKITNKIILKYMRNKNPMNLDLVFQMVRKGVKKRGHFSSLLLLSKHTSTGYFCVHPGIVTN